MRKILGLDLGTTSIGWAVVNEAENVNDHSTIQTIIRLWRKESWIFVQQ